MRRRLPVATLCAAALLFAGATPSLAAPPSAPAVASVSPPAGPATGGTRVTITGSGFSGASGVGFGGTAAKSFHVQDDTTIVATAPAGRGTVDVTVSTPTGTSAAGRGDRFAYGPVIGSLDPSSGSVSGGTTVTIRGAGFDDTSAVMFGSTPATAFTVDSDTEITATAPPGGGTVGVTVTGSTGTSGGADYAYLLKITGAASGPAGNQITLTGIGFAVATAIHIGSGFAGFAALSDTQLVVVVPTTTDPDRLTVVTPYGSVTGVGSSVPTGRATGATGSAPDDPFPAGAGRDTSATGSGSASRPIVRRAGSRVKLDWRVRVARPGALRVELIDRRHRVVAHRTLRVPAGLVDVRLVAPHVTAGLYRLRIVSAAAALLSSPVRLP